MNRILRNHGLSIVLFFLFLFSWLIGQALTGYAESNQERTDHGKNELSFRQYLTSAHFLEATAENWESEFLQMGVYVALTVFLFQKGSAESKDPDKRSPVDLDPRDVDIKPDTPWPVKRGGWVLRLYENSLTLAFLLLFLICFIIHLISGCANYNEDQILHGQAPITCLEYFQSSRFWFESLQNWQSEFLAIFSMVWLSIYLRQRGSPESKPVHAPHNSTGS